jgi:hypothetical protein
MKTPSDLKKNHRVWRESIFFFESFRSILLPKRRKDGRHVSFGFPTECRHGNDDNPAVLLADGAWLDNRALGATACFNRRRAGRINGLRVGWRGRRTTAKTFAEVASGAAHQDRHNR